MNKKILMPIALMILLPVVAFVSAVPNEQDMYNSGYTSTTTCGNNICEQMYFEINPNAVETHKINGQDIVIKTETSNEERPRTAFSFNEIKDRLGGDAKEINPQLKSKYGFAVSDIAGEYDQDKWPDDQTPLYYRVTILEQDYCLSDCMQGLGKINIEQGWNIISEGVLTDLRLNNINKGFNYESDITAVYQYVPVLNKYILIKPIDNNNEEKIAKELVAKVGESKAEEVFEQRNKAVWVYSTKKATIYYKKDSIKLWNGLESIKLFNGWNFLGFNEDMFEGRESFSWNKAKGNCNYEKIYAWNPETMNWMEISPQTDSSDYDDFFGSGMLVKVTDDCNLGVPNSGISPPELPGEENEITCTDSDWGDDIYVKGITTFDRLAYEDRCVMITSRQNGGYVQIEGVWYNDHTEDYEPFSSCDGENCYLAETYCVDGDTQIKREVYACPNGCSYGACIQ